MKQRYRYLLIMFVYMEYLKENLVVNKIPNPGTKISCISSHQKEV